MNKNLENDSDKEALPRKKHLKVGATHSQSDTRICSEARQGWSAVFECHELFIKVNRLVKIRIAPVAEMISSVVRDLPPTS